MKILSPRLHGYLDYAVVVLFLLAPMLFGLSGVPAIIAYALSVIHLLVTVITNFPLGLVKVMSFKIHSAIEFAVSFLLMALPWLLGFASIPTARNFYVAVGIAIFLVWLATDYKTLRTTDTIH